MRTAIDTNVLYALWSREPLAANIAAQLAEVHSQGGLVICAPVYVELLAHPLASQSFVDDFLAQTRIAVDFDLDESIWRISVLGFVTYAARRRSSNGGSPKRLLIDFVIAAHATVRADCLMTLDSSRYRQDFPKLQLV